MEPILLVGSANGIYSGQVLAENYGHLFPCEEVEILKQGPSHEEYIDAWVDVEGKEFLIDGVTHTIQSNEGNTWPSLKDTNGLNYNQSNHIKQKLNFMASKHTPGPWALDTSDNYVSKFRIYSELDGANVLWVDPDEETINNGDANTRLIAAAPELLEALKVLAYNQNLTASDYKKAFAAIDKAEGK